MFAVKDRAAGPQPCHVELGQACNISKRSGRRATRPNAGAQGSRFRRDSGASAQEFYMSRRPNQNSQAGLVAALQQYHNIEDRAAHAMLQVDRSYFVPEDTEEDEVYRDCPQAFKRGTQTISAPHMHGHALSQLDRCLHDGASVLDVGSGSGYLTAAFAVMAGRRGSVLGVETAPKLVQLSLSCLHKWQQQRQGLPTAHITIRCGNAWQENVTEGLGPFDAIHVGAAARKLPQALLEKLKPGGLMLIPLHVYTPSRDEDPMGSGGQMLTLIHKDRRGIVTEEHLSPVAYVPLSTPLAGYERPVQGFVLQDSTSREPSR